MTQSIHTTVSDTDADVADLTDEDAPKHIHLSARRWSTYHSVTVIVDGDEVAREDFAYGYGEYYKQTAFELLEEAGLATQARYDNGGVEPLWQYCQKRGIKLTSDVADVSRRKDL